MWLSMNCTYKKVQHNKYCLFAFVCLLKMFIMLIFYISLHICLSALYPSMSASHTHLHFSLLCYYLINLRGFTGNVFTAQVYSPNLMSYPFHAFAFKEGLKMFFKEFFLNRPPQIHWKGNFLPKWFF